MITNALIVWNVILTILCIYMIMDNGEKQTQINKIEMDIENNRVFDIITEEHESRYLMGHFDELRHYDSRIITVKEAIACLYKKFNFRLSYTPEKTETTKEDVSIK